MAHPKVVQIEVHGQQYPIRTELDPGYVQELADFVVQVVHAGRTLAPDDAAHAATMAMAVVGGINELVLQAIESGRSADLVGLTQPCSALVRAVLVTPG